jgi:ABC-2 type transport system permease protein
VLVILNLLSGSATPPESMPDWLIEVMKLTPTPHFVSFAQNVLYRAAGLDIVWPQLAALAAVTAVFSARHWRGSGKRSPASGRAPGLSGCQLATA